jgi:hypothetical protein
MRMKNFFSFAARFLTSLLIGLAAAFAFAAPYLAAEKYTPLDRFALVAVPAFSLTFILYFLFPYVTEKINGLSFAQIERPRLLEGWLLGTAASFVVTGFVSYFYKESYQLVLLILLAQLGMGIFSYYVIGRARKFAQLRPADFGVTLLFFLALTCSLAAIFKMNSQFPILFKADIFLLEKEQFVLFFIVSFLSLPPLAWILSRLKEPRIYSLLLENKFISFIRENLSGLLLSSFFFYLYLLIGSVLNHPRFDVDDIFFDADGFIWRYRLTTDHWQDFYWRSVHPLALLILRPLTHFLAVFLNGDLPFAAIVLTAATGAACVFLAWLFLRGALENNPAALIMASLLGLSASHLFFGSLIETYIFLAALTLFCFVLMQRKHQSLPLLLAVGVATLGITLTNFAQTVIAVFCSKPDFKFTLKYISLVVALTIALMLVGNVVYPNASPYFFVPSSLLVESENMYSPSTNRVVALARAFAFNNFAAPTPLTSYKDIPFTQFRFYRPEEYALSRYVTPLQYATEKIWIALLVLAAIFFVKDFKSHPPNLTLALIGCLLVNLVIHLRYGRDLFLYSSNWTYAVTLLLGISWKSLLKRGWFQVALIAFLVLLTANNLSLFYLLMEVSAPYVH